MAVGGKHVIFLIWCIQSFFLPHNLDRPICASCLLRTDPSAVITAACCCARICSSSYSSGGFNHRSHSRCKLFALKIIHNHCILGSNRWQKVTVYCNNISFWVFVFIYSITGYRRQQHTRFERISDRRDCCPSTHYGSEPGSVFSWNHW